MQDRGHHFQAKAQKWLFFFKEMMYYASSCCCLEQHLFLNLLFNVFIFPPVRLPSLPMVALPLTTSSIPSCVSRDKKKYQWSMLRSVHAHILAIGIHNL